MGLGYRAAEELYKDVLEQVTKSREDWLSFLNSSTWMFEYSFYEQLLIYGQRPEARACATMADWNRKALRWIKKNSKAITILKYENGRNRIEYLFDIADTYPKSNSNVELWKLDKDRQWRELTYTLVSKYGDFENKSSLEESLVSAIDNFIEDSLIEYYEEFKNISDKGSLNNVEEEELKFIYTETIKQNLIYTVFTRCDLNPFTVLPNHNFQYITYFDNTETINNIGVATRDLSRDMIREIRAFVKNKKERGGLNENRIQSSERLSNTKYRDKEQRSGNDGQIRKNEGDILERKQTMYVRADEDDRNVDSTFELDTENLRGEITKNSRTDETKGEHNRRNEIEESTTMGWIDEQLENDSRVNDNRRNDIQLESLLSEEEQKEVITGVENTSVFSFTQEMIDSVLCEGGNVVNGKFRIYKQLTSISSSKENIEFLKNEYGIGGRSADSNGINEDHSPKGIVLMKGYKDNSPKLKLSWNEVEKRIKELIRLDRYFNSKDKEEYEKWLLEQQEIIVEAKVDNVENEMLYKKGDNVFIGNIEYEIIAISSKEVLLSEVQYPLLIEEMSFEEFDRKAKENPYNTHLIKKNRTEEVVDNRESLKKKNEDIKTFIKNIYLKCYSDYEIDVYENTNNSLLIVELKDGEKYSPQLVLTHLLNEIEDGSFNVTESEKARIVEELKNVRKQEKEYVVGKNVSYDNSICTIKDVIEKSDGEDEVVLENNETKETTTEMMGFAIFLVEEQKNKEKEKIEIPKIKKQRKNKIEHYDLYPEIPLSERSNYKITTNELGVGSVKEKFARNIEAIKVLKRCQEEKRYATKEEQEILANYVGWGGLAEAFDKDKTNWSKEYEELKSLLTEKEYNEARQSTLTAFYTPPVVIKAIYQTLENMGLKEGNILEPSCGIGNFMGMIPDTLNKCKLYGVEIDSISGEIARQLYQKNTIAVKGFEEVEMPDSFFDVAVGNVPFGDYKLTDKRYDKNNFLIHDYFYAKTLDKVRPDGVIAFITSKGTMDKKNNSFRKYIAQRAELLGAIRLANDVFTDNAGTKTTTDIIFLQKKDKITDIEPSWLNLGIYENGIEMNQYFIDNPNMILGKMEMVSSQYGMKSDCIPYPDSNLEDLLSEAINNINAEIKKYEIDEISIEENNTIPAIPTVRNYSYAIVDDKIYYRENSLMYLQEVPLTTEKRIKGMVEIRECLRNLIELQTEDASDEEIKKEQGRLNLLYDKFTATYGIINSRANEKTFAEDDSYYLLCSLEILKDNGEFDRKADMFYKRTIKANRQVSMADNAVDALILSISNKACVDMEYMKSLTSKSEEELVKELEGSIYKDPIDNIYVTADEYLSGNVREKLKIAQKFAENDESLKINVQALEKVKPTDLTASEISVRLGTTWIPTRDIEDFIYELLDTNWSYRRHIKVSFSEYNSTWNITGKNEDRGNVKANNTYGTNRINAYKIIENTLNLKDVKIFDNRINEEGKEERVLNAKETAIAQARQDLIKNKFQDWIWKDQERRERLVNYYNENFNNIKLREYDGQYIIFNGMNPEFILKKHQLDAVARILYGGNTLLAHKVGAGKTFEMVAAAMESKRLGLCEKSLFIVPNHIVSQIAGDFLRLYPSANILVTTKSEFSTNNRKRFCSKIATGDYDAIIMGHSQFQKIPMSKERQEYYIRNEIEEIVKGIEDLKLNNGERYSIKQLETSKKRLEEKLKKLNDSSRKDNVINFEELGVDRIFVDESHYFKNLFVFSKMRNVAGISQTEAQKSSDLFMKCRYLDELTNGKGIIFATGTPISNSMVEMYTVQRYLQYNTLKKYGILNFDSWASVFGETITAIELTPEGTGYRAKTRFARFNNLPELMNLYKQIADIKTSEELNLPVPKANYHIVKAMPSEIQESMVKKLGERAEKIRKENVDPKIDNMLKITNDGRKLALDQRLINNLLPDFEGSKVNMCADNIYEIWKKTKNKKSTQLVFCDLSTPKNIGTEKNPYEMEEVNGVWKLKEYQFTDIYTDLKRKLIERGIPEKEIAFIHDAVNENQKKEIFSKVRNGEIRVLMGSTPKMGAGTNVQDKITALHHLDVPWKPSDLEQTNGRGIRQGNENPEVDIFYYVTEKTFDAYSYQLLEVKQKFSSQIMTSKVLQRSMEDIDKEALSYAEIKALTTGNPLIIEKMELETDVSKLKLLKQDYLSQKYSLEDAIVKFYPVKISSYKQMINAIEQDLDIVKTNTNINNEDKFSGMKIKGKMFYKKDLAGKEILEICKIKETFEPEELGVYRGLKIFLEIENKEFKIKLKGNATYSISLGNDAGGNIIRLDNAIENINKELEKNKIELENTEKQLTNAKKQLEEEFQYEDELTEKQNKLSNLNALLNLDKEDNVIIDDEIEENKETSKNKDKDYER